MAKSLGRRKALRAMLLAGPAAGAAAQGQAGSLEAVKNLAAMQGAPLSEERLRAIQPAVERRLAQVRALREAPIDGRTEPAARFKA